MLSGMVEYGCKMEEKVKAMKNEMKIYRDLTVKGRKLGFQLIIWNRKKK